MSARIVSEPFANVDAAWLHMEDPTSMAMITGVMTFDAPIDFERLKATIEYRMLTYRRFTMRVREPSLKIGVPRWEVDPTFDLNAHLHRIALPEPRDQETLQDLVGDLMSTPLDFTKPLWQLHLIEGFGEGCAVVIRLHHCIADGLALMQVFLSMADDDPEAPWPEPPQTYSKRTHALVKLLRPAVKAYQLVNKTLQTTENLLHESMNTISNPSRLLDLARLGAGGTLALGKVLLIGPDQKTIFKGKCGVTKRAAWSRPIPLEDIKAIGRSMGGTINDVLLSAVAGALRRYLESREQPTEGVDIRAMVPVNIRQDEELEQLGNKFGLVFLSLPVGVEDPLRRLRILKKRMDAIKNSPEAFVTFSILGAIGLTPIQIERIIVDIFARKATAVMTNVPGPRQPKYWAGQRIRNFMFWVPSPGNLGMGVSIFSFAGDVVLGFATDACLVPDPQHIIDDFHAEIDSLMQWKQVEPELQALEAGPEPLEEVEIEEFDLAQEIPAVSVEPPVSVDIPTAEPAPVPSPAPGTCQALTREGRPCKNRALPGSTTCRVHTPTIG